MKKILIIGSSGFIGSHLAEALSKGHHVECIYKNNIDVLNTNQISNYLMSKKFNVIINCLTFGGKEDVNSYSSDFVQKNITLFYNFFINSAYYDIFINIGSGAEFDKTTNINLAKEEDIFYKEPKDAYGFFKNFLARSINKQNKFTTLRLFGCFGKYEPSIRLLKKYQQQNLNVVDRYFDFFSIQDFVEVVRHVINNNICGVDINCVYSDKLKISEFLSLYDRISNRQSNFVVDSTDVKNYTGNSSLLDSIGVKLNGLYHGLRNYNV